MKDNDYKKLMKKINKDNCFKVIKTTRKSTIKVVHIKSNKRYSVHPSNNAVRPLQRWIKKVNTQLM